MQKKILLIIAFLFFGIFFMQAQTLVSTNIEKKNAVLEEYTGMHCQYCPEGHAISQALYDANPYDFVLINIHTGTFAVPQSGEPDYRTEYGDIIASEAAIGGFPAGSVNRHYFSDLSSDGGISMSRGSWGTATGRILNEDSPVNVGASTSYNSATRELTVNVELYYTSNAPTSSNFINIALVQNKIIGPQQNLSTWVTDYEHNHMLRDSLTGQWGDEVTTTTQGTFIQRTYTYTVPNDFNGIPCIVADCDVAVFVSQDHKEILSGVQVPAINGTTYVIGTFSQPAGIMQEGTTGTPSSFNFDFTNGFSNSEDFTFTLTKENEPSDWSSNFSVNGNTYASTGTETFTGNAGGSVTIDVVPGASSGFAKYTLTAASVNNPTLQTRKVEVYVIANTGTLLVHASGSWNGGSPPDFETNYFDGFDYATVTDYTSCSYKMFMLAAKNNKIGSIHTIFYNVAWTFPGLNEDITLILTSFLDNGGNLFIAGQDLAWGTWQNTGTTATQSFFTNYLNAAYQADGSTSNSSIYSNPADGVFGNLESSSLVNVYGGSNMYPDELTPEGYGTLFLYYLNNTGKGAAIKATNGSYKVVYLGFDPPMISDVSIKNEIIKRSIDWFNGAIAPNVSFSPKDGSNNVPITTDIIITFDQGVRNIDDSEIVDADISNLVTFETTAKVPIAFSGTINAEKTQITITPDANLDLLTDYTVRVESFENDNNLAGSIQTTTFTTAETSVVYDTGAKSISVFPNPAKNQLTIQTDNSADVLVYDVSGKVIFSEKVVNEQTFDISNLGEGVYFIKINNGGELITRKFVIIR